MNWSRLVSVMCAGVLLLGSLVVPPAFAIITNTVNDQVPGSLLVFPIFDVIGANRTKIEIVNRGGIGAPSIDLRVRVTYVCQPLGSPPDSNFCPVVDQNFSITHNQTLVLDVGDQLFGTCPTGQGYIVAWAEQACPAISPATCPTATGGTIQGGEIAPISYNQLYGSYYLYYNGAANPPATLCGGVPCSPPPLGLNPAVEAANAIAFESYHPIFSFLGNDVGGALSLTFGSTPASDYVALGAHVQASFAAPGAPLIAGPSTFPPFIPPDTVSGTELQTNIILLNLNVNLLTSPGVPPSFMSVNAWNWFEAGFSSTHRFLCWERIPIDLIDPRLTFVGPFGANYGQIRFTPAPAAGPISPQLLGAVENVTTVGRTIRNMIHSGTAASPATFTTDIEP